MFLYLSHVLLANVIIYVSADVVKYPNGCVLNETPSALSSPLLTNSLRTPFINCSSQNLSSLNFSIFDDTIASLTLTHNEFTTFNTSDVVRFSKLNIINLGHNKISSVTSNPSPEVKYPGVTNIFFGFNQLQRIPKALFTSFKSLVLLSLVKNNISVVEDGDFVAAGHLMFLHLASNPITKLSPEAFSPLLEQLVSFDISDCGLTEIPEFIGSMSHIFSLVLKHNQLTHLDEDTFLNNTAMRLVTLTANQITHIHPAAFHGAPNLMFIELSDNKIETLPAGVFDQMADEDAGIFVQMFENPIRCDCKLQWLGAWLESIQNRDDILFTCTQPIRNRGKKSYEITSADLTCKVDDKDWTEDGQTSGNSGTTESPTPESNQCPEQCTCYNSKGEQYHPTIPKTTSTRVHRRRWGKEVTYPFVDCTNAGLTEVPQDIRADVKFIRLKGNRIESLDVQSLSRYSSLEILNIEGCGLKTIVSHPTLTLNSITILSIQNNELTSVTEQHLKSFSNLEVLRINHNKIKEFPKEMFFYNRKLKWLYIGPNPATNFTIECLKGLELQGLSLRNLSINTMPHITLKNLSYLELSDNLMTSIPNNSFSEFPNLFSVLLGNNRITQVEVDAFKDAGDLSFIDLTQNKITTLPQGLFDDLKMEGLRIELWKNRFYCDCKLRWMKEWINEAEKDDPTTEVRFSCFKPWRFHGRHSTDLSPEDFTCEPDDPPKKPSSDTKEDEDEYCEYELGKCYSGGHIALTIFLTIVLTLLSIFIIRWYCTWRKNKNRYKRSNERAPLELDM